jgi:hypothetical protein
MAKNKTYTTLLTHGGAMVDEMRILIDRFNPEMDINKWVDDIVKENVLGKASRAYTSEIISRFFLPRFVNGQSKNAWKALKILCSKGADLSIIRSIMYYHTARIDDLLYDFVVNEVFERYYTGQTTISADDVYRFIESSPKDRLDKQWSDSVKGRLSRGVLSVLRDFGILEGKSKKKIADFYLPLEAFAYVAFLLYSDVSSGDIILNHDDWKLFLLKPKNVERMFLEAHQHGFLKYNAAGNLIRIDFEYKSTEELANDIVSRSH